ncbi:uncharacterized protein LOC143234840 isoform X3 [Tachypleus tridentatus]|uniref:uncharacterized protein LOC143234840 isoform X3 n=1 Tax=Tachypleus tridentatus TaxID=6853 RepID=UPI003FCF7ED6
MNSEKMEAQRKYSSSSWSEKQLIEFWTEKVNRFGCISLQNLTGHASQLPVEVRNIFGSSKTALKKFLSEHPDVYYIDKKNNVWPALCKHDKTCHVSVSNHKKEVNTENIDENQRQNISISLDKICESVGKIYRVFPVYGFITITQPVKTTVYFDVGTFEDGTKSKLYEYNIKPGDVVYLNAKRGPEGCEAHYRATKVWRQGYSLNIEDKNISEIENRILNGHGVIQNIFNRYGFIEQDNLPNRIVFFHMRDIENPTGEHFDKLDDVLKKGEKVSFHAIPSSLKNSLAKWQATSVFIKHFENKSILTTEDEQPILNSHFTSSSDKSDSGFSNYETLHEQKENLNLKKTFHQTVDSIRKINMENSLQLQDDNTTPTGMSSSADNFLTSKINLFKQGLIEKSNQWLNHQSLNGGLTQVKHYVPLRSNHNVGESISTEENNSSTLRYLEETPEGVTENNEIRPLMYGARKSITSTSSVDCLSSVCQTGSLVDFKETYDYPLCSCSSTDSGLNKLQATSTNPLICRSASMTTPHKNGTVSIVSLSSNTEMTNPPISVTAGVSSSSQYTNNAFLGHSPLTEETLWTGALSKLNPLNKEQLQSALISMIQVFVMLTVRAVRMFL